MQANYFFPTDYCGASVQIECTIDGSRTRRNWWADLEVVDVSSVTIGGVTFHPVEDKDAMEHWKQVANGAIEAVEDLAVGACERLQQAWYQEIGV